VYADFPVAQPIEELAGVCPSANTSLPLSSYFFFFLILLHRPSPTVVGGSDEIRHCA
jgi:hypothetical protein